MKRWFTATLCLVGLLGCEGAREPTAEPRARAAERVGAGMPNEDASDVPEPDVFIPTMTNEQEDPPYLDDERTMPADSGE